MVVQVEFQSLIGDANCVNSDAAPPKCLVRSLEVVHSEKQIVKITDLMVSTVTRKLHIIQIV